MCEQSIRDRAGKVWTGRLTDHLGSGLAEIDVDGKRHIGVKITPRSDVEANAERWREVTERAGRRRVQR